MLRPGGRLAVISFHSLEDRMVKRFIREVARGCICPPDLPVCGCGREPEFRLVTRRAVRPDADELAVNPAPAPPAAGSGEGVAALAVDAARAHAPALRAPARPRARAQPRARRFRLAGSVVWIAVLAALLAGVVALNVAVLRLNLELDELGAERARLQTENAELASTAAIDASPERIKAEAAVLGYRAVDASEIRFVHLAPDAR